MRVPESLVGLLDQGIIEEVIRPLMSGKEARVYLVAAQGRECVAKVYKDVAHRSFKNRADYTEGRRTRNSRDQRAMQRGSRYGRAQAEAQWRTAEADIIFRLHGAGVRVPEPLAYVEEVLLMELVKDAEGHPAPRLADVNLAPQDARDTFALLVKNVQKMLCTGVVHGDLSEFNVLVGADGPVIIDFPQAVDPAQNRNARKLLTRDVANLRRFLGRRARSLHGSQHAQEMWDLYERGELTVDTVLTGSFKPRQETSEGMSLLEEIEAMERENREKRIALGLPAVRPARQPVAEEPPRAETTHRNEGKGSGRRRRKRRGKGPRSDTPRQDRPNRSEATSKPRRNEPRNTDSRTDSRRKGRGGSKTGEQRRSDGRRRDMSRSGDQRPKADRSKRTRSSKPRTAPVVETVRLPPK